ncbi:MAG: hypothetical protein FVQ77_13535 [Cytophagales bacterium]|nr:hypothetical protein [Cytophagales bacterium]
MKKRLLILTGAGAVIDWGANTTPQITDAIINDDAFKTITEKSFGKYIYEKLISFYHKQPELVNFETILNYIENLHTFFFSKYTRAVNKFRNANPVFFNVKDDIYTEALDFSRLYEKTSKGFVPHVNGRFGNFYWNDYHEFIEKVYLHYINLIGERIRVYCSGEEISKKSDLNDSLIEYLKYYKSQDYIIRYYTLNYDRLPVIASGMEFFEGFTNDVFDEEKVLNDTNSDCYYNLHGSLHYKFHWENEIKFCQLPIQKIELSGLNKDLEGNSLLNSQMIFGLKKAQQIFAYPYYLYSNMFLKDYVNADEIHFIGYSFNDAHFNCFFNCQTKAQKIFIIDYFKQFEDIDFDSISFTDRKRNIFLGPDYTPFEELKSKIDIDKTYVFVKGFRKYLEKQNYT